MSPAAADDHCHFFLSYAHSAPLSESEHIAQDTDRWVRQCFEDLSTEVAGILGEDPGTVGFADYLAEPGADGKAVLSEKLGLTRVFVPLYSPGYFNKSWPMRERAVFLSRLESAFPGRPDKVRAHIVPVLWIPLPDWDRIPELNAAQSLGAGVAAYAENGLRALCMLAGYRDQYRKIIYRLARRIVEVTRRTDLPPGRVIPIEDMPAPESPSTETPLVVGLVGVAESDPGIGWRPFGAAQAPPIAAYVANVAERLGLPTKVIGKEQELKAVDNSPAVLVVDPWVLEHRDNPLGVLVDHLHPWVTPIVVCDRHEPRYSGSGAELVRRATDKLSALGAHRVHQALDVEQVAQLIPSAVSEARRQFLRHAPVFAPAGSRRPRLTGDTTAAQASEKSSDD